MQFNVASLLKEPTGATREHDIDDDLRIDGEPYRITGHVRFDRTRDGILVRAALRGTGRGQCSRCLKPLTFPVEFSIGEEFMPTVDVVSGGRVDLPDGADEAYRIDERHMLDLAEPVRQYWAMAVPMAPLCEEGCRGLCPVCGQDLAADAHECSREQVDARWAKLQQFRAP